MAKDDPRSFLSEDSQAAHDRRLHLENLETAVALGICKSPDDALADLRRVLDEMRSDPTRTEA
jgi:hypothetical protein